MPRHQPPPLEQPEAEAEDDDAQELEQPGAAATLYESSLSLLQSARVELPRRVV